MTLPDKDLHTRCLRCGAPQSPAKRHCARCGADRELELAVAGEINPAIATLRRWLAILGALALGNALLLWEHFHDLVDSAALWRLVGPSGAFAIVLFGLAAFARRAPLVVAIGALVVFAIDWGLVIALNPVAAFTPNVWLALRVVFAVVLVGAVRSGFRVRRLRRDAEISLAQARVVRR